MNMVIPNEGKTKWLDAAVLLSGGSDTVFNVKLYQNNYTPVDGSTAADFTEATFTGYTAVALTRSTFGAAAITSNVAYSTYPTPPAFNCTGGSSQTIYGWYMVGATSGKVYAAQKFDTARTLSPGASETLDPFKIALETLP